MRSDRVGNDRVRYDRLRNDRRLEMISSPFECILKGKLVKTIENVSEKQAEVY